MQDLENKVIAHCSSNQVQVNCFTGITLSSSGFSYRPGGADRPYAPLLVVHWRPHESIHVRPYGLPERILVLFLIQIDNATDISAG